MDKTELQKAMAQFIDTLPDDKDIEWFSTDKSVGQTVLNAFLWWLHPELRPKDLPPWTLWPLRDEDEVEEPASFAWLAGHSTIAEYRRDRQRQKDKAAAVLIWMYEWRNGEHLLVPVAGEPILVVDGDQSWFEIDVVVAGYDWCAVYNEDILQWGSCED